MSTEAEQDEATRRQAAINEALAVSDACWRMEQDVLQRQLAEWRSRAEYAERELSAALDLPPSIGPAEGEAKRIVETLRRERDQLLARLRAVYPWIGVTPFVPAAIAHLSLERDLARDSIEEISADIRRRGW